MAILTSDKVDFRANKITRDKEEYYTVIKEPIHQEYIAILNVCAPNNRASKHMKQNLIEVKGETDKSIIRVGNFNTHSQQQNY